MNAGSVRKLADPNAARPIASAVTELSTTRPNDSVSKSRRITSSAKKTPAIGALNVAEIPPAAPHATRSRSRRSGTRASCPIIEPSAEPICTIGPSRPTEPPDPMQSADASALTTGTCGRIRPPNSATASITSGTPCPRASGAKRATSGPYSNPPAIGASATNQIPNAGRLGLATCPAAL